jgi:hypothetical protein
MKNIIILLIIAIFMAIFIIMGACGQNPTIYNDCYNSPVYEYSVFNSQDGLFDIIYIDEMGIQRIETVQSGWTYSFSLDENNVNQPDYFYIEAYGSKAGDTSATLYKCGEIVIQSSCPCQFPILEFSISVDEMKEFCSL